MKSERYIINYYGIESKYYTNDYVAMCWELAANQVYESCKIYVSGSVEASDLICGEIRGCELGKVRHSVIVVRNPAEVPDGKAFREAVLKVISETREMLGNPNMSVAIDEVEFYYFKKV